MNEYSNTSINLAFRVPSLSQSEKDFIVSKYDEENSIDLKNVLKTKKVRPVVGKMMMSLGVDTDYWSKEYDFFLKRNQAVIKEIDDVFFAMQKAGITKIFAYENFGALLSSGSDIALYSSGDVDLYADVCNKDRIETVMHSLGYEPTRDVYDERCIMTEYLNAEKIIRVNIDWIILRRKMFPITISLNEVIDWNHLRPYEGTHILLPSKEALLYLCLLRIAVHGFSRSPDVRLYIDIQNCASVHPDWDSVIRWAKRDKVLTKVITVAYIAHKLNGVEVPRSVVSMAMNDKYAQKIIRLCYDEENRTLKYDPTGMELFKVEAASDNKSVLGEVLTVICPSRHWLKSFYEKSGDAFWRKYINYYKHLIGK